MAKLNGVKAVAEAIEYNGMKYEKVNLAPKAGDILRVDESGDDWVTEVAKWAAIGRKVGEFKKGDVVKYDGGTGGNALNGHKDILTTIVEDDGPCGTVTDDLRYRLEKPDYVLGMNDTWTRGSHLKLVAPVESVVNLSA